MRPKKISRAMFIPHTKQDIERMLEAIGCSSIDELYASATGMDPVDPGEINVPPRRDIVKLSRHLTELAAKNSASRAACFCGGGAYDHFVHPAMDHLIARTEFLTAYTPYQSEVSQGTLQAIFEFQTMAASLLGTDVANASMYDGASAAAEAALMAGRVTCRKDILVSSALHPEYRRTIESYLQAFGGEIIRIPFDEKSGATSPGEIEKLINDNVAAVVMGYPNFLGVIEDLEATAAVVHASGALLVSSTSEGAALGLLEAPGRLGADIAVCEGLSLGLPMSYGGPGVGLFGCRRKHIKQIPGRLAGRTVDADGNEAYVLTLAMREQHIRRERATSNICTNQNLCALAVTIHLSLLGPEGFRKQAELCAGAARTLVDGLAGIDALEPAFTGPFFNEVALRVKGTTPQQLVERLAAKNMLVGPDLGRWYGSLGDCILVAVTECASEEDIEALVSAMKEILG
ncbi:MAG: aminomethyl-transferring glycine dehydrogenase subunit GcvPA [Pseudomonadota bacterium]